MFSKGAGAASWDMLLLGLFVCLFVFQEVTFEHYQ